MARAASAERWSFGARARSRTPGKYIVLFLFAPVCLVALGAGVWLNTAERRAAMAAVEFRAAASGEREAYFALSPFLVDLAPDADGRSTYLRMQALIVIRGGAVAATARRIEAERPALTERLTFFLRELRPEDFRGADGMARVKAEMLRRVNLVLGPGVADEVVIEDLVIQ